MIHVTLRGWDKYQRDLETFSKKVVKDALRDALNGMAFETRREWSAEIEKRLTTRNKYTSRTALRVEKASGRTLTTMQSKVGSIADYMDTQEQGGTTKGPIPGPTAAGQKPGGKRTKPVRATNRVRTLLASKGTQGTSRKQRNAVALAMARRTGKKVALLERPNGGKGLFRITGGKRTIKTRLIWTVGRGTSKVKATPTLGPVIRRLEPRYPQITHAAMLKQLRLHHVLGY